MDFSSLNSTYELNNCSNKDLNNLGNASYIKKFLFNICSENTLTNVKGYITEKIINCCKTFFN